MSKSARDTQGTLISGGTGSEEHGFGSVRHGGRAGNGYYRLYGKFAAREHRKPFGARHVFAWGGGYRLSRDNTTPDLAWRPSARVELSLVGRDLLHAHHLEFVAPTSPRRSAMERAVYTRISVAF